MKKLTRSKLNVPNLVSTKRDLKKLKSRNLPAIPAVVNINNTLSEVYLRFLELANLFREKVREECDWSLPTFYRKLRGGEKALSNAEREKVLSIEQECIQSLMRLAGMKSTESPEEPT